MKTFIIALMFIVATVLPILFIPLLALTIVVTLIVAPSVIKHGVWTKTEEDRQHELELKH